MASPKPMTPPSDLSAIHYSWGNVSLNFQQSISMALCYSAYSYSLRNFEVMLVDSALEIFLFQFLQYSWALEAFELQN